MTTAIFDGVHLAADSRITHRSEWCNDLHCGECGASAKTLHSYHVKIQTPRTTPLTFMGDEVVAWVGAGNGHMIRAVSHCIRHNLDVVAAGKATLMAMKDSGGKATTCTMLVVTAHKVWTFKWPSLLGTPQEVTEFPFAIGSGGVVATFAVKHLGMDPLQAVACAADTSVGTGGQVGLIKCRNLDGKRAKLDQLDPPDMEAIYERMRKAAKNPPPRKPRIQKPGVRSQVVLVIDDKTREITEYPSVADCCRAIGLKTNVVCARLKSKGGTVYKDGKLYLYQSDYAAWLDKDNSTGSQA